MGRFFIVSAFILFRPDSLNLFFALTQIICLQSLYTLRVSGGRAILPDMRREYMSIKNQVITLILAKISQGMKAQDAISSVLGHQVADKLNQLRRHKMKRLILALALIPSIVAAECDSECQLFAELYNLPVPTSAAPSYGLPVQPALPVPQDKGPWGTGYSIVTSTRPQRNLYDRDVTGSETVQRIVPNDALGQPMRGLDLTTGW